MKALKILLVTFLFIFASGVSNAQYLKELKSQNKTNILTDTTKKKLKLSEKSPLLAGSLSFFLPGLALGQLYNEDLTGFGIHLGISGGVLLFLLAGKNADWYELSTMNIGGGPGKEGKREWIFVLGILSYAGNWLWSTIDAVHYAAINNRELDRQRKTGYDNIRLQIAPGIGKNNKPKLNISVYF